MRSDIYYPHGRWEGPLPEQTDEQFEAMCAESPDPPGKYIPPPPEVKPVFSFDAETHTYTVDGVKLPSVTQVIRCVVPHFKADEWYLQRGNATHHGTRLLDQGRLDWSSVDPEIEPRIKAWQRFVAESKAEIIKIGVERPLWHQAYRYAGTIDRQLVVNNEFVLADLKNSLEPSVELQLGGYSLLLGGIKEPVRRAVAVHLKDDGTYLTRWFDQFQLRSAERAFLNTLGVFNWMQAVGTPGHA